MSGKRAPDRFGAAPVFQAVFEIAWLLPENGVGVDGEWLLALVLVPNCPHPCTGRTILQGPEKLRRREWAAVVQHADQKRRRRFPGFFPAPFKFLLLYQIELF